MGIAWGGTRGSGEAARSAALRRWVGRETFWANAVRERRELGPVEVQAADRVLSGDPFAFQREPPAPRTHAVSQQATGSQWITHGRSGVKGAIWPAITLRHGRAIRKHNSVVVPLARRASEGASLPGWRVGLMGPRPPH